MKMIVVAIGGASGAIYGVRLVRWLVKNGYGVDFLISSAGRKIFAYEIGEVPESEEGWRKFFKDENNLLKYYDENDFSAPLASGSAKRDAMVIIPRFFSTLPINLSTSSSMVLGLK